MVPRLAERAGGAVVRVAGAAHHSIPESTLAERLEALEDALAPLTLAYLPGVHGVDLRLTAWNLPRPRPRRCSRTRRNGCARRSATWSMVRTVPTSRRCWWMRCGNSGTRVSLGESCTGGLVGARITAVPGSSAVFQGGVVCYSNAAKTALLGVASGLIESTAP